MNQRLEERLTNERKFSRYSARLEEAWRPHEARIIREQVRKDAQQEQATRNAAKAILMFEQQEAERNPWIAASKMTAMQDVRGHGQAGRIVDNQYRVPAIGLGLTRSSLDIRNGNQRARLSGGYGETERWLEAPTNEAQWMQNLLGDKVDWSALEKYRDVIIRAFASIKEEGVALGLAVAIETAILMVEERIPMELRRSAIALILELTVCQALVIAANKWELLVGEHMRKYNCSREEAEKNRMLLEPFLLEIIRASLEYFVEVVLKTIGIPTKFAVVIKGILSWFLSGK